MPSKIELCNASDVEVGAVLKVERDDLTLAVFNVDGEFFVTDNECTHGAASLAEFRDKARFVRISGAGLRESHVHDVTITRESPNYPSRS